MVRADSQLAARGLPLLAFGLLLAGCDWRSDGEARLAQLYPEPDNRSAGGEGPVDLTGRLEDGPGGSEEPGAAAADITLADLRGCWAVQVVQPASLDLFPGAPQSPYPLLLTDSFVAEWSEETLHWRFCHQEAAIDAGGLGATEMPAQTAAALGAEPLLLEQEEGPVIPAQKLVWTWGLKELKEPASEPLPTSPDDPRVRDQDRDGNPGVTIEVLQPAGLRFMVRRTVWNLAAPTVEDGGDRLVGTVTFKVDEQAVGYQGSSTLKTIIPVVADPAGGSWAMVRTKECLTCEQLIPQLPKLFPAN